MVIFVTSHSSHPIPPHPTPPHPIPFHPTPPHPLTNNSSPTHLIHLLATRTLNVAMYDLNYDDGEASQCVASTVHICVAQGT